MSDTALTITDDTIVIPVPAPNDPLAAALRRFEAGKYPYTRKMARPAYEKQKAALQADLIISTGGVSVGEADFVKPALADLGTTEFWKIAIKPGRPLTFGQIEASIFMGLPGNPVAVMVTFSQFVVPAIHALAGAIPRRPALFRARSLDPMRKKPGRYEFQRGIATLDDNGEWQVAKTGKQGSGILTSMSRANCFIVLPDENTGVEVGDEVKIQFFDWSL